jgi:heme exporter protein D
MAYFATLVAVRIGTTLSHTESSGGDIVIGGAHIHHLVFGIAAILVAGVFALDETFRLPRAALFGIGAALVLDEFALVVFLKDVYWLPQSLLSWFAVGVGLLALLVNAWRSGPFWRAIFVTDGQQSRRPSRQQAHEQQS